MPKYIKPLVLICSLLIGSATLPVRAEELTAGEYEVKAAFMFNLGSFISWPEGSFGGPDAPFHICVLGADPFGKKLDVIVAGQKIQGHPVEVRRLNDAAQAGDCEELFISDSEQMRLQAVFEALQGKPVVTVGDTRNFVANGGMIQFFRRSNKIRLMLDPVAFEEVRIKPSANLMRIVRLVRK